MDSVNVTHAPSIDAREVAHYSALASTWWDRQGPFWPLHRLNELRVAWIRDVLASEGFASAHAAMPLDGLRVLDIGCGGGILSESLARLGAHVHGVDVVEKNIGIARAHASAAGIEIDYQHRTVESLARDGAQYDVIFNMEVVEHVADFDGFMDAASATVRPGGAMFVATINRNPLAGFVSIFGAERVLRWLPVGTHHYSMLRKPSEVVQALRRNELDHRQQTGVRVNPLTRRFSLTPSLAINYMVFAIKAEAS